MIVYAGDVASKHVQLTATGKEHDEFVQLVNRALNTWDTAPKWLKDLGDRLAENPPV